MLSVAEQFHEQYYSSAVWRNTFWLGVPTQKCPLDLWIYQEILVEIRPDVIIETGTASGGSALFLASMCDLLNHGRVITIDIETGQRRLHPRISYLHGSSTSPQVITEVATVTQSAAQVLVILDSDHTEQHVLDELRLYSGFVTPGSYVIVEDTNVDTLPVARYFGSGPMKAVQDFMRENSNFVSDRSREKFFLTFNPKGYLRRTG